MRISRRLVHLLLWIGCLAGVVLAAPRAADASAIKRATSITKQNLGKFHFGIIDVVTGEIAYGVPARDQSGSGSRGGHAELARRAFGRDLEVVPGRGEGRHGGFGFVPLADEILLHRMSSTKSAGGAGSGAGTMNGRLPKTMPGWGAILHDDYMKMALDALVKETQLPLRIDENFLDSPHFKMNEKHFQHLMDQGLTREEAQAQVESNQRYLTRNLQAIVDEINAKHFPDRFQSAAAPEPPPAPGLNDTQEWVMTPEQLEQIRRAGQDEPTPPQMFDPDPDPPPQAVRDLWKGQPPRRSALGSVLKWSRTPSRFNPDMGPASAVLGGMMVGLVGYALGGEYGALGAGFVYGTIVGKYMSQGAMGWRLSALSNGAGMLAMFATDRIMKAAGVKSEFLRGAVSLGVGSLVNGAFAGYIAGSWGAGVTAGLSTALYGLLAVEVGYHAGQWFTLIQAHRAAAMGDRGMQEAVNEITFGGTCTGVFSPFCWFAYGVKSWATRPGQIIRDGF